LITDSLYAIVDVPLCRERQLDPLAILDAFLAGGARLIQLRDKSAVSRDRLALADAAVSRAHARGAQLIVNDRADIARLSGADGVHVGQGDLPVDEVRAIVGAGAIVGISTHDEAQIGAALRTTASYIAVGPIYDTATKDTGYTARGLALVRLAAAGGRPVVAIGGITIDRAAEVLAAGAAAVAVISDLLRGDPREAVRQFRRRLSASGTEGAGGNGFQKRSDGGNKA
jgi:thiamine-phosphate pyrophosphorylase